MRARYRRGREHLDDAHALRLTLAILVAHLRGHLDRLSTGLDNCQRAGYVLVDRIFKLPGAPLTTLGSINTRFPLCRTISSPLASQGVDERPYDFPRFTKSGLIQSSVVPRFRAFWPPMSDRAPRGTKRREHQPNGARPATHARSRTRHPRRRIWDCGPSFGTSSRPAS